MANVEVCYRKWSLDNFVTPSDKIFEVLIDPKNIDDYEHVSAENLKSRQLKLYNESPNENDFDNYWIKMGYIQGMKYDKEKGIKLLLPKKNPNLRELFAEEGALDIDNKKASMFIQDDEYTKMYHSLKLVYELEQIDDMQQKSFVRGYMSGCSGIVNFGSSKHIFVNFAGDGQKTFRYPGDDIYMERIRKEIKDYDIRGSLGDNDMSKCIYVNFLCNLIPFSTTSWNGEGDGFINNIKDLLTYYHDYGYLQDNKIDQLKKLIQVKTPKILKVVY